MKDKIIVRIELVKLLAIFIGLLGASVGWILSTTVVIKLKGVLLFGLVLLLISLSVISVFKIYNILKMLGGFK